MKRIRLLVILGMLMISCMGCNASEKPAQPQGQETETAEKQDDTEDLPASGDGEETDQDLPDDAERPEDREVENMTLTTDALCGNEKFQLEVTGLKEYEKMETEKYTDTPGEGNVYLVLFLKVQNHMRDDIYFDATAFSSQVDGNTLEHTFLVNDPEEYRTMFQIINAETDGYGYIVWEVPKDWKELTFDYTGWDQACYANIHGSFTPDDLMDITEIP